MTTPQTPFLKTLLARVTPLAAAMVFFTGCAGTFHEVRPSAVSAPPRQRPSMLVIKELKITDTRISASETDIFLQALRRGVNDWCVTNKVVSTVQIASPGAPIPPDAIALSGNVTEVEKGSAAMRFWVGMGAGQSRIVGDFSLADNTGATLTTFKARRSYLGGAGIGGFDTLGMDQLFYRLGSTVGETTGKWLDGKKIE